MMKNLFQRQPYIQAEKKRESTIGYFSKALFLKLTLFLLYYTYNPPQTLKILKRFQYDLCCCMTIMGFWLRCST